MIKVLIIIPAFNEEKSIRGVIENTKKHMPDADIVVINDGSTDNTSYEAKICGVVVIDLIFNIGIGGAMQTGYKYANYNNYDIAIQLDGDGQHDPVYIKDLLSPILENRSDMVIGSRYLTRTLYKSKITRRIGMIFFSKIVSFLTGKKITDPTSGFRAVNKAIINYFSYTYPSDYPEVDVLVRLNNHNFHTIEVSVEMKNRQEGKSSITSFKSVYYMIKVSLALFINSLRTQKYS
jgi:hypothetical protein